MIVYDSRPPSEGIRVRAIHVATCVALAGLVPALASWASADAFACVVDQSASDTSYDFGSHPYLRVDPGTSAAQTFVPSRNMLCTVGLMLWDGNLRLIGNLTIRGSLDGPVLASKFVDSYYTGFESVLRDINVHVTPGKQYAVQVDVSPLSAPLQWFWATTVTYPSGSAWIRNSTTWEEVSGPDLSYATYGFDDTSSYPLPDPAWTQDGWRRHNWKTYPVVATWMDVNADGKGDVYTFNNSYLDGNPVAANGSVNVGALDRTTMAPANLSMAFEFTSYTNSSDNRSSLRIFVERIADPSQNGSAEWPAWILMDSLEFLPLLFSPSGTSIDALNLTWESTLEENAFRVYVKPTPEHPQGEVWIYIGHFSAQSIIIRGFASRHLETPTGLTLLEASLSTGVASIVTLAAITLGLRRLNRRTT